MHRTVRTPPRQHLLLIALATVGGVAPAQQATGELWSLAPLRSDPPPEVQDATWAQTEIDRFVFARLRDGGIKPAGSADRRTWLRRASFDLIGLPPTAAELEAFVADVAADADKRQIKRLLESPHYGERWGRHWLDLVRYADTAGDASDFPIADAHRYRSYVIDAFNRDLPYDQFVAEQIAGDLMAAQNPAQRYDERLVATGFLALARRFGTERAARAGDPGFHLVVEDTIDTVGRAVLGLTLACARCHDHKSDPFTQRDYYGLYGIFASTRYPHPGSESSPRATDLTSSVSASQQKVWEQALVENRAQVEQRQRQVDPLERQAATLRRNIAPGDTGTQARAQRRRLAAVLVKVRRAARELAAARDDLQRISRQDPRLHMAYAVSETTTRDAFLHIDGDPKQRGSRIPRAVPIALTPGTTVPITSGSGRLELAGWLTGAASATTARVIVNRIWQHHFGVGLVRTPSNFGTRGARPSHPALLDWLAQRLIAGGWSVKTMHRLIMSSHCYRFGRRQPSPRSKSPLAGVVSPPTARRGIAARHDPRGERRSGPKPGRSTSIPAARCAALHTTQTLRCGVPESATQHLLDDPETQRASTAVTVRQPRRQREHGAPRQFDGAWTSPILVEQRVHPSGVGPFRRSHHRRRNQRKHASSLGDDTRPRTTAQRTGSPAGRRIHRRLQRRAGSLSSAGRKRAARGMGSVRPHPVCKQRVLVHRMTEHSSNLDRRSWIRKTGGALGAVAFGAPLLRRVAPAQRVIFVFSSGGVSHVDTFDPKPLLNKESGQRFAKDRYWRAPLWKFRPRGACGTEISDLFPKLAERADDIALVRSMRTDHSDHMSAVMMMHTGSGTFARPSLGAWVSHALGTANPNLPTFTVLAPRLSYGGSQLWSAGFLPARHQGVRIASAEDPIPHLRPRVAQRLQQMELAHLAQRNRAHLMDRAGDTDLAARMRSYETAAAMQKAAPDVFDLRRESDATLAQIRSTTRPSTGLWLAVPGGAPPR